MPRVSNIYNICPSDLSTVSDKVGFGPDNLKKIVSSNGRQPKNGLNLVDLTMYSAENGNIFVCFDAKANYVELFEFYKTIIPNFISEKVFCNKEFSVFINNSNNPVNDGYLSQVRIIPKSSIADFFGSVTASEYDFFCQQPFSMSDFFTDFVLSEKSYWYSISDFEKFKLGFGLMVEDEENCVYRLFSRLIKK